MIRRGSIFYILVFTRPADIRLHEAVVAEPAHVVPGTS